MIKNKSLLQIMVIFIIAVTVTVLIPSVSKATISSTGYDFEKVEVGTSKTTIVRITNLGDTDTEITVIKFVNTTCSDFSVVYTPDNQTIPAKETMEVEISYAPSAIGTCSDTLSIYNGTPFPSMLTFVGTGVEPVAVEPALLSAQNQIHKIQSFVEESLAGDTLKGTGKNKATAQNRIKTFNKMLVIAAHMIENGNIQAAHNKLVTIYQKVDGKPNPEDFVTGDTEVSDELAKQIQDLISSLNSI
ncbi:choice-of-anchor D domain-containing protein [Thermodesulfobacteriota bacterium]